MGFQVERLREWFRTSLAVVPLGTGIGAYVLAKLLTRVDRAVIEAERAWFLFGGTATSAEQFLSTVAASLMQFTAVVFSITILVLQLASSQFSPRVLRTFLDDRSTQWTMGIFIGSFVYATTLLLELRTKTETQQEFVPALGIFVAFVLILLSVVLFVHYLQNMAHAIRAVHVIRRVAEETRGSLKHMYPETILNEEAPGRASVAGKPSRVLPRDGDPGVIIRVHEKALMKLACRHDVVIGLLPRVGDFVPRGAPLFQLWGQADLAADELRDQVVVAYERTPLQDPAFGFRQLVDVAERALSPGINDPTTAVQALDQLHDLLRALSNRAIPSPYRFDDEGCLRLILPRPDWDDYVHLALDEIRVYGKGSIQVLRKLRILLNDLMTCAPAERLPVLRRQLDSVEAMARANFEGPDERYAVGREGGPSPSALTGA